MPRHDSQPRILVSVLATVGLLASGAAHASLIGDAVDISLVSPVDSIDLQDLGISVGAGSEIRPGNNTVIGGDGSPDSTPLLSNEFLDIQHDRIILQLETGFDDGNGNLSTGYGADAFWLIAGLDFAGGTITGFNVFLTGFSVFDTATDIKFIGGNTFQIFISDLLFVDSTTGFDVGRIEIELVTDGTPPPPPVPEPGTLALLALGLGALAGARRRRPR